MKVVVDANRFFAALLSEGAAREALMASRVTLVAPVYLLREVERHRARLQRRAGLDAEGFDFVLQRLSGRLRWISDAELEGRMEEAKAALGAIDPKDVPYLACALAVDAVAIWSHDKDFDRQDLVRRVGHPDAADRRRTP